MKTKLSYLLLTLSLFLFLFTSCENMINAKDTYNKDVSFKLGTDDVLFISRTLKENLSITDDSVLKIKCYINGPLDDYKEQEIALKDLSSLNFHFKNMFIEDGYSIKLFIYYNSLLLYQGKDSFNIKSSEPTSISLLLEKVPYNINFVPNNGGAFETEVKSSYFFDDTYILPEPKKMDYIFEGWFCESNCLGERVFEIGKNNFLGNVTLYGKWRKGVNKVENIEFSTFDKYITLSWKEPKDTNYAKVEIVCDDTSVPSQTINKGTTEATFKNLTNDKLYNFTFKTIDNKNGPGVENKASAFAMAPITLKDELTELSPGTDGTIGTSSSYVLFGYYPQTLKEDSIIISKNTVAVNGLACHYGSDKNYYVEQVARSYAYPNSPEKAVNSDSKVLLELGKTFYFKVEPIKWRVLDANYKGLGGKLLLSEQIINNSAFQPFEFTGSLTPQECDSLRTVTNPKGEKISIYRSNYEYSKVRAFLNGLSYTNDDSSVNNEFKDKGFLQEAFSTTAANLITKINVDNSPSSIDISATNEKYYSNSTNDKIFVPSFQDMVNGAYGFSTVESEDHPSRVRHTTDYAKARGTQTIENHSNQGWYTLRSPGNNGTNHCRVQNTGLVFDHGNVTYETYGVVPALVVGGSSNADTTPPTKLDQPTFTTTKNSITLNWKEPIDSDYAKVNIVCNENDALNKTVRKGSTSAVISNLTEGTTYTFNLTSLDYTGNESEGVTVTVPFYVRTTTPTKITEGASEYILFGDYPQHYVKDAPVGSDFKIVGAYEYYYGTDGNFYVQKQAKLYNSINSIKKFRDGSDITDSSSYYFKVEPIKWKALWGTTDTLLLSEEILVNSQFVTNVGNRTLQQSSESVAANEYNYSIPRAFLNGLDGSAWVTVGNFAGKGFVDTFIPSECKALLKQRNKNGEIDLVSGSDIVFTLDHTDITTNPPFITSDGVDSSRERKTTDFAIASGAFSSLDKYNGTWWLMDKGSKIENDQQGSPTTNTIDYVKIVGSAGGAGTVIRVDDNSVGLLPAIVIDTTNIK